MKNGGFRANICRNLIALFIAISIFPLASCDLWGARDNPADSGGINYQGYDTVADPAAIKPVGNSGVVSYTPELLALKVAGAEAYQFQLSLVSDFSAVAYTSPESASNEFLPSDCPGLTAATTYYWRVRVKKNGAWSPYSGDMATFSLSAPNAGTVSPVDASTVSDTTPLLDWGDLAGASGYELQIADTSEGLATTAAIALSVSQYQITTGLKLGAWYWRVRAKNADNVWGAWTATWSFTAAWVYVLTPTPTDTASIIDTTPLLDWNDADGAAGYELQIAPTSEGVAAATAVPLTASEYQYPAALALGDARYWRVRAKNADAVWGAWSPVWSFTAAWTYVLTPTPADTETTNDTTPLLDWNDAENASGYELQIASVNEGVATATAIAAAVSQYQYPSTLAQGDARYWRVRAKNADNVWGEWSTIWRFTIDLSKPALGAPADGAAVADPTPDFDWSDVAGSTAYWIQISASNSFTTTIMDTQTLTVSAYTATTALADKGTYYWRVAAKNADGVWSAFTLSRSFTMSYPPAATPSFNPAGGTYTTDQTVAISCATLNSTIYYTVNGDTPTTGSTLYTGPIAVSGDGTVRTIKVIAVSGITSISAVATAAYTILYPAAATPSFNPVGGTYTADQTVAISCATANATIYYTTNGDTPTTGSTPYTGTPISVAGHGTVRTIKAIGISSATSASAIATSAYTIAYPATATPTFNPPGGTYTANQTVTINCATPGATIYYTTNGTTPTTSSAQFGTTLSTTVDPATTIKAIAKAPSYSLSAVGTAIYTAMPRDGLVGEWLFSGNANDTSGNGNNGTVYGATLTTDRFELASEAYSFNGNSNINFGNILGSQIPISISLWYSLTSHSPGDWHGLITKGNTKSPGTSTYTIIAAANDNDNPVEFSVNGAYSVSPSNPGTYRYNEWHHLCCMYDGVKLSIFQDDIKSGEYLYSGSLIANSDPLIIGKVQLFAFAGLYGLVDDVRIYNRALTESEISQLSHEGGYIPNVMPPTLIVPADGAAISDATPDFDWSDVTGAAAYRFQISTSSDFSTTVADVQTLTASAYSMMTVLSDSATYYWHVAAKNAAGVWCAFTEARSFTVSYPPTATPTFNPPGGTYTADQTVAISCSTANAIIYYTTDGATPTTSSNPYAGAITVAGNGTVRTIKAIAISSVTSASAIATAAYTIAYQTAATPTFNPPGGTYTANQTVTINCATPGATIYYTTNGDTPTTSSAQFGNAITATVNPATTIKAIAMVPQYLQSAVGTARYSVLPLNGLAGEWLFNGNANDTSSNNNSGTISGATLTTDRFGNSEKAYSFNGSSSIIVPSVSSIPAGNSPYTIVAWIYALNMGDSTIVHWGPLSYNQSNAVRLSSGATPGIIHYWIGNDLNYSTGSIINQWHLVTCSFDGVSRKLYLNETQIAIDTPSGHNVPVNSTLMMGTNPNNENFIGNLDDVRIYDRVLSESEISQLCHEGGYTPNVLPPTLIVPADGVTINDTTPDFDWTDVTGAAAYHVQIANDVGFTTIVDEDNAVSSASYNAPVLANDGVYYWRVAARNDDGVWGSWSTIWRFTVAWNPTVSVVFPSDGASILETTPLLDWSDASLASSYRLQIAPTVTDFTTATTLTPAASQYQVPSAYENGSSKVWRVAPVNADGVSGTWQGPWGFTVSINAGIDIEDDIDTPPVVTLSGVPSVIYSGENVTAAASSTTSGVTWTWYMDGSVISGAASSTCSFAADSLGLGYHSITARATVGTVAGSTYVLFQKIDMDDPWEGIVTGMTPANGATITDSTPLLDWATTTSAESYELQIASTSTALASSAIITCSSSNYQVPAAFTLGQTRYWRVRAVNGLGLKGAWSSAKSFTYNTLVETVFVSGGTFQMGSNSGESNEQPVHTVALSSFKIGKYEITQAQYQTVMGSNPASGYGVGDNNPVYLVSWYDAIVFCNKLSIQEGLTPVYTINSTTNPANWGSVPTSFDAIWNAATMNPGANGYRLPTEAEWVYAATGGSPVDNFSYAGSETISNVAWFDANSSNATHPVGQKAANKLGLYDLTGNLWEWGWDWLGDYPSGAQTNPVGAASGSNRVAHGGCYANIDYHCRIQYRGNSDPLIPSSQIGLRIARSACGVSYSPNGATTGSAPVDTTEYNPGQTVTAMANSSGLARIGHTFGGWNTLADGTGTTYAAGSGSFAIPETGMMLYAKWMLNPSVYTDEFNVSTLNAKWTVLSNQTEYWNLTSSPGSLLLHSLDGEIVSGYNYYSNLLVEAAPTGDFSVCVRVSSIVDTSPGSQFKLILWQDSDNCVYVSYIRDYNDLGVGYLYQETATSYTDDASSSFSYLSTLYLLLSRLGTTYYGYLSSDGSTWTAIGTVANSIAFTKIGLWASNGVGVPASGTTNGQYFIDYIRFGDVGSFGE